MLGKRLIKTSAGAACTTDTVQILDGVPFQSIATYELDGDATNLVETGYINKAGVFNGSSSRINLPSNPINGLSSVSFSFWIKPNDIASYQYVLSFINSVDGWNGLGIRITNTGKIQVVRANSGAVTTTENSTTTLSLNVWQHVAVSVQQSGAVIYINGSPDGTFSSTPFTTNNTGSFDIGMNEYASGTTQAFTNGSIDQVRIFNRVITANEVTTLYGETSASSTKSTTDIFADSSALALYEFEGNANDTGGTYNGTATNVVYNEYDGTASNVTYSTGKFGQAAVFNGSSSYISLPFNLQNTAFSISFWAKNTLDSNNYYIIANNSGSSQSGWHIGGANSGGTVYNFRINNGSSNYLLLDSATVDDTDWHHVVVTWDNTTNTNGAKIYINGSLSSQGTSTSTTNFSFTNSTTQLMREPNGSFRSDGNLDQVRVYDKAISAADVTTLYNETVATASTNITLEVPSLVAYYKMNDATDETGSYDGTPTNVNFNVAGKFGNAGEFNGSSSVIVVPNNMLNTSGHSVSMWFNLDNTNGIQTVVEFDYENRILFRAVSTDSNLAYVGNSGYFNHGIAFSAGQWYHLVITFSAGNPFKIYVDGVLSYTGGNTNILAQSNDNILGSSNSSGSNGVDGKIDQVRIFDRAITADEVTKLYEEVECIPTIVPTDHFNPVLYTGTGSGSKSVTGVGFEPDLVWGKARNAVHPHILFDSVRGENKQISSNETSVEVTRASDAYLFDPDGFTVTTAGNLNNAFNYVAWNWKAGGAAVSNTDGTITSQVSANTDAGFSIVSYTGNQSSSTIGHGLSQAPEMIIAKSRTVAQNWAVYHKDVGSNYWLQLNGTIAKIDEPVWNDTTPTDSVFSMNANVIINKSGSTNIAYCFHSVDGMSRIGSYVGTGASGNAIVTGFRPAFLMVKRSNSTGNWSIVDNKRNSTNERNKFLFANESVAEGNLSAYDTIDFTSNGFILQDAGALSGSTNINLNGSTYIFMAFAEENVEPKPVLANSFNTVTYTGNGSATQSINTVGFQPDLVWIKARGLAQAPNIFDSIRGGELLRTSTTSASGGDYIGYINNGFQFKITDAGWNQNGQNYVSWNWKASNESTINQEGSITSIVSANPASGFSVVRHTGTGSAATVGHGLSSTPELIIRKDRDAATDWWVYASVSPYFGYLNHTDAFQSANNAAYSYNQTVPTSTIFNVGNTYSGNVNNNDYIAYCFHSVDGYQSVGSYSGSGGAGNAQDVGFAPDFLMIKSTNATTNWAIFDTARTGKRLQADLSNAEGDDTRVTLTSTGFQFTGAAFNETGRDWIYLAIKAN